MAYLCDGELEHGWVIEGSGVLFFEHGHRLLLHRLAQSRLEGAGLHVVQLPLGWHPCLVRDVERHVVSLVDVDFSEDDLVLLCLLVLSIGQKVDLGSEQLAFEPERLLLAIVVVDFQRTSLDDADQIRPQVLVGYAWSLILDADLDDRVRLELEIALSCRRDRSGGRRVSESMTQLR